MPFIDAHVHVYTDDTARYPLAPGFERDPHAPVSFTPEQLFAHTKPAGVSRINLIQIRHYGFDNSYMFDAIAQYPDTFVGTAVIDPFAPHIEKTMIELATRGIRAFRIHRRLSNQPPQSWLRPEGYIRMFAAAARTRQVISCLLEPDGLNEIDRMCASYPDTPVVLDHLARVGFEGAIRDSDVNALCSLARHRSVYCKLGAFYALGKKQPPYTDLAGLIQRVVNAFGPERCMWESDCPFQLLGVHTYRASLDLIRERLDFLSATDKDWLLGKTAEQLLFGSKST